MILSSHAVTDSSIRILAPVSCRNILTTLPDLPMTPPIFDTWQRRRSEAWPGGMGSGCAGRERRFDAPLSWLLVDFWCGRFAGGERNEPSIELS